MGGRGRIRAVTLAGFLTTLIVAASVVAAGDVGFKGHRYDAVTGRYTADLGFPVAINSVDSETLTIAKDSTGTLWATWTSGDKVWVNRTQGADTVWGTPYVLATGLDPDDVSAIVAFGGSHVGVMWSDQRSDRFVFAIHDDGAGDGAAAWDVRAVPGVASADD